MLTGVIVYLIFGNMCAVITAAMNQTSRTKKVSVWQEIALPLVVLVAWPIIIPLYIILRKF